MISILITEAQKERLRRPLGPCKRFGGWQYLIKRLQGQIHYQGAAWLLSMSLDDARKVIEYSNPHVGAGTYQAILREIAPQVAEALQALPPERSDTGSLFDEEEVCGAV